VIPAGRNCSAAGAPPGIVAEPDTENAPVPAVIGSTSSAASRPDVEAPGLVTRSRDDDVDAAALVVNLVAERGRGAALAHERAFLHAADAYQCRGCR
jgi:hypothetical protein